MWGSAQDWRLPGSRQVCNWAFRWVLSVGKEDEPEDELDLVTEQQLLLLAKGWLVDIPWVAH